MADVLPSLIASRYRVIRELGRGGMGVVYIVEHIHTGDQLALKLLLNQAAANGPAVERFKREARAAAKIKSDHVVRVVDADVAPELDGAPFLVMELLDGADLQKQIDSGIQIPAANVLQYLGQVARALDKAHAIGIVHRDLKPENIFLHRREDGSSIVKILDFGISKFTSDKDGNHMTSASVTSTGEVMGTPYYMAPEQARGQIAQIGPRTDIWAVGLIALQLLTGEIYWRATTIAELMVGILAEPLYPPSARWPALPSAVDTWFAKSCARDPAQRFGSVGEQILALGLALQHRAPPSSDRILAATALLPTPAPTAMPLAIGRTTTNATTLDPLPESRPARVGSRQTLAVLGGLALIGLLGIGAAVGWPRTRIARPAPANAAAVDDMKSAVLPPTTPPSTTTVAAAAVIDESTPDASAPPPRVASTRVRNVPSPPPLQRPISTMPAPSNKPFNPTSM